MKRDAEGFLVRGYNSVKDGLRRIRIGTGGPSYRDLSNDAGYGKIGGAGPVLITASDDSIDNHYHCDPKQEPEYPSVTKVEKIFDQNGHECDYDSVLGTEYIDNSEPAIDEGLGAVDNPMNNLGKAPQPGGSSAVFVDDLFKGSYMMYDDRMRPSNVTEGELSKKIKTAVPGYEPVPDTGAVPGSKDEETVRKTEVPANVNETGAVVPEPVPEFVAPVNETEVPAPEAEPVPEFVAPVNETEVRVIERIEPDHGVVAPAVEPAEAHVVPNNPVEAGVGASIVPEDDDDEVIYGKFGSSASTPSSSKIDGEISKEDLDNQNRALDKASNDILNSMDGKTGAVVPKGAYYVKDEDMIPQELKDVLVLSSSTGMMVTEPHNGLGSGDAGSDEVEHHASSGSSVDESSSVSDMIVNSTTRKIDVSPEPIGSVTVTTDEVARMKEAPVISTITDPVPEKKTMMDDPYAGMSQPKVTRPYRFTDGALVRVVESKPKVQEVRRRKTSTGYTLTEEKKKEEEARPTLNRIMADSKKNARKIVTPVMPKLVFEPIRIEDEVEGLLRLTVPGFNVEEFGVEEHSALPEDGIEELVFASSNKDSQVVFLFGGDGYGDDVVSFNFGF